MPSAGAPGGHGHAHHDFVGVAQRHRQNRVELFAVGHEAHHALRGVGDLFRCLREVQQAAQRRRVGLPVGGAQHPQLQALLHVVDAIFDVFDLGGQAAVAQHERGVGQADRDLRQVLHLDEHVDGAVEVRRRLVGGGHGGS